MRALILNLDMMNSEVIKTVEAMHYLSSISRLYFNLIFLTLHRGNTEGLFMTSRFNGVNG